MPRRLLATLTTLVLLAGALGACGDEDVSTAKPRTTPELTLPAGELAPGDAPTGEDPAQTGTTETDPGATTGTDTAPTTPEDTTQTDVPPAAQGATGGSELESFCQENPGAC